MMDGTKNERAGCMMQNYQKHKRYCPSQTLIYPPEQLSLNLAPDLYNRDHSAATAHRSCEFSAASLQYSGYITLYGAAILFVFSTHTSHCHFHLHQNTTCLILHLSSSFTRTSLVCSPKELLSKDIGSNCTCLSVVWGSCYSSSKVGQN